jgi:oligopeptide transport system substrate-binding protein
LRYAIWEGLYQPDRQTLDPKPGVASAWTCNENKTVYTFHLRPEAKWSNGDPVTTKDFVFAWRRHARDAGRVLVPVLLHQGRGEVPEGLRRLRRRPDKARRPDFKTVGIEALDERTAARIAEQPVTFMLDCGVPAVLPLHEKSMQPVRAARRAHGRRPL